MKKPKIEFISIAFAFWFQQSVKNYDCHQIAIGFKQKKHNSFKKLPTYS